MEPLRSLMMPAIIIAAWCSIFLIRLVPVGGHWTEIEQSVWMTIIFWMMLYFVGIILGISRRIEKSKFDDRPPLIGLNGWIQRLSFFAFVGAVFIIYEFAVTRAYGFSTSIAVIRQSEVAAASGGYEGSWVSGAGRMLTPALMPAWILAVLGWESVRRSTRIVLTASSAAILYQQIMFEGGRFFLASLLVMLFVARMFSDQYSSRKISVVKKMLLSTVIFFATCVIFGYVFVDRYQQTDRIFSEAYQTWAANFDLEVNDEVILRLSGNTAAFWLAVCMLWAYVTQGINELNSLLTSGSPDLAWGAMQFPQIAQMLNKLTGLQFRYNELENLPNIGTYITLFGASYVDFGYLGAFVFMGFIGWVTGLAIGQLHSRRLNGLSICAPVFIALGVFAPIVSLVVNLWPAFCWALFVGSALKFSVYEINKKAIVV